MEEEKSGNEGEAGVDEKEKTEVEGVEMGVEIGRSKNEEIMTVVERTEREIEEIWRSYLELGKPLEETRAEVKQKFKDILLPGGIKPRVMFGIGEKEGEGAELAELSDKIEFFLKNRGELMQSPLEREEEAMIKKAVEKIPKECLLVAVSESIEERKIKELEIEEKVRSRKTEEVKKEEKQQSEETKEEEKQKAEREIKKRREQRDSDKAVIKEYAIARKNALSSPVREKIEDALQRLRRLEEAEETLETLQDRKMKERILLLDGEEGLKHNEIEDIKQEVLAEIGGLVDIEERKIGGDQ